MSFQDSLDEIKVQMHDFLDATKEYFAQLNDQEKYAWGAEGFGVVLLIVGIVLFLT